LHPDLPGIGQLDRERLRMASARSSGNRSRDGQQVTWIVMYFAQSCLES
jgi:hypothetical protein